MKLKALVLFGLLSASVFGKSKPWIFFDLGGPVVTPSNNFTHLVYSDGAHAYLTQLRKQGYHLGLMVNLPEDWGLNGRSIFESFKLFMKYGDAMQGKVVWKDPIEFDWTMWESVLLPPRWNYRKPESGQSSHPTTLPVVRNYLFLRQLEAANGCPVLFQGDSVEQIEMARKHGLAAHHVKLTPVSSTLYRPEFLPISKISEKLKESFTPYPEPLRENTHYYDAKRCRF